MPTLLHALSIPIPEGVEGQRLDALTHPVVTELYRSAGNVRWKGERFRRELRAIYVGDHKLLVSSKPNDPDAGLFDLSTDPEESTDLSDTQPGKVKSMLALLAEWSADRRPLEHQAVEDLDPETRRQMEALGYLDRTSPQTDSE